VAKKFNNRYKIKSARCDSWDYGWNSEYFITICTLNRIQILGEIVDHKMILSESGKITEKYWHSIPDHFDFVQLVEFVVMPDHIHGILKIIKPQDDWDYDGTPT
jgi:REP element-mobilizing transposase RayT